MKGRSMKAAKKIIAIITVIALIVFLWVLPLYGITYILSDTHEGQELDYAEFREREK